MVITMAWQLAPERNTIARPDARIGDQEPLYSKWTLALLVCAPIVGPESISTDNLPSRNPQKM